MKLQDFRKLRNITSIDSRGQYIVAYGRGLYILDKNGKILAQRKDLRNVFKIAFITDDTIIADCGSIKEYVLMSLPEGEDIGRIKQPKMNYSCLKFLISANGQFVYDYYFLNNEYHIAKIDIKEMQLIFFPLQLGLRATVDFILDENEELCFLQTQIEEIAKQTSCCSGIRYEYFDAVMGYGNAYYWKSKWVFDHPKHPCQFLENVNEIITNDLYVYDPTEASMDFLLENDHRNWNIERSFSLCRSIQNGRLIIIYYNKSNIIIDRKEKCVIARYFAEQQNGCIIDNQYWISSNDGIICKPFPYIEK